MAIRPRRQRKSGRIGKILQQPESGTWSGPYLANPDVIGQKEGRPEAAFDRLFPAVPQKPMPPIPPMPPPPGIAGAAASFGSSATIASVVTRRPATEEASCRAVRTTLAG